METTLSCVSFEGCKNMMFQESVNEELVDVMDQGPSYVAGYLANRIIKKYGDCEMCIKCLRADINRPSPEFHKVQGV